MTLLTETEARALVARAFCNAGVSSEAANNAATGLVLAEMMGISTHGLSRVRVYVNRIRAGGIDPAARPKIRAPAPALRHLDAANGLGPAIAQTALLTGMEAARHAGMAGVFCHNANHLGALAPYLWQAAEAGFACIITTNTSPMIAPTGGRAPLIGNNPLGIGIPNPGGVPVFLDMALSVAARSHVRAALKEGRTIPETWATDADGSPTTDPAAAMRGLMQAIGGAKGANLALSLDLLAAGLSGARMLGEVLPNADETPDQPQGLGQMFLLINTKMLLDDAALHDRMEAAGSAIAQSPSVVPNIQPRLPGARAAAALLSARQQGFTPNAAMLADLRRLAAEP
jgi:LDH2 family malate/lactate/ureidoglycolate dehydrogenase